MRINLMHAALLVSILLSALACSQPNPVAPSGYLQERVIKSENHDVWGYYTLIINPAVPSVEIVESRSVAGHFNVKPFVSPPARTKMHLTMAWEKRCRGKHRLSPTRNVC